MFAIVLPACKLIRGVSHSSHCSDPNTWQKQHKGEKVYVGSWFQRVSTHYGGQNMAVGMAQSVQVGAAYVYARPYLLKVP